VTGVGNLRYVRERSEYENIINPTLKEQPKGKKLAENLKTFRGARKL